MAAVTRTPVASLTGFTYRYPAGRPNALEIAQLSVGEGLTVITGASGSGKSSLLRVFNGLVPHFHGGTVGGSAVVCGHDVITTATRVLATKVGFVFQDPELQSVYPTVERDVAFGLENIATPPAAMPSRVAEALDQTGIVHLRGRAVATLSGGERQRLALAGVLAMRPRVLVLDEPLSQLDEDGARGVVAILGALARSGTAVVVAEHRLDRLGQFDGRRLAMEAGRAVDAAFTGAGPIGEMRRLPAAPRTAPSKVAWQLRGVATGPGRLPGPVYCAIADTTPKSYAAVSGGSARALSGVKPVGLCGATGLRGLQSPPDAPFPAHNPATAEKLESLGHAFEQLNGLAVSLKREARAVERSLGSRLSVKTAKLKKRPVL